MKVNEHIDIIVELILHIFLHQISDENDMVNSILPSCMYLLLCVLLYGPILFALILESFTLVLLFRLSKSRLWNEREREKKEIEQAKEFQLN